MTPKARGAVACAWLAAFVACSRKAPEPSDHEQPTSNGSAAAVSSQLAAGSPPLRLLYLPDAGDVVQNQGQLEPLPPLLPGAPPVPSGSCPADMVSIRGRFCIDRYEDFLVDARERELSPYYPPSRAELSHLYDVFRGVAGRPHAPALPVPPEFSREEAFEPRARSRQGVVPSGYLSGLLARRVCENAGKRLCTPSEWVTACKGEGSTKYPYGNAYQDGACNVFREAHPAVLLHGDASKNHLDPRLNLMASENGPLLRKTGDTPRCQSHWGADAVYDMVGNLDEWVDDPHGAFQGGFYARATREGCDSRIAVHPNDYFDYSLGVRCCR